MKDVGTLDETGARIGDKVRVLATWMGAKVIDGSEWDICRIKDGEYFGSKPTYGADHSGTRLCSRTIFHIISRAADETPGKIRADRTVPVFVREGYDSLFTTLCKALHQAQDGKGNERHAQTDQAFEDQPIIQIGRLVGMGFQHGQAIKKTVEAQGMLKRGEFAAAEREILGAINYLAAMAIEVNHHATEAKE